MSLPKRNLPLRIVYGGAILGMFGFLIWQSLPYDEQGRPLLNSAATTETTTKTSSPASVQPPANTVKRYTREVGGLSTTLDLNGDLGAQINSHWQRFANSALAVELPRHQNQVYAVYHDYDANMQHLRLTLGFITVGDRQYKSTVTLQAGRYLELPEQTVLDSWQNASRLPGDLRYETDYERYQLNRYMQPVSQVAYVAVKQEAHR